MTRSMCVRAWHLEREDFFFSKQNYSGKSAVVRFFILWHAPTLATWGRGTKFEQQPTKIMSRNRKFTLVPRFFSYVGKSIRFPSLVLPNKFGSSGVFLRFCFRYLHCRRFRYNTNGRSLSLSLDRVSQTGICNLHKIFLPEKKKREIFGSPNFVGSCYQYMPHAKSLWFPRKKKLYGRRKAKPSLFTFRGRGCQPQKSKSIYGERRGAVRGFFLLPHIPMKSPVH